MVRLTKVVHQAQPLFNKWMQRFEAQEPTLAAADLIISPVTTGYVVDSLKRIGAGMLGGCYHLSGEHDVTYFELALAMARARGLKATVERDWVRQRLDVVPFPAHSALSMEATTAAWGLLPQPLVTVARELTRLE